MIADVFQDYSTFADPPSRLRLFFNSLATSCNEMFCFLFAISISPWGERFSEWNRNGFHYLGSRHLLFFLMTSTARLSFFYFATLTWLNSYRIFIQIAFSTSCKAHTLQSEYCICVGYLSYINTFMILRIRVGHTETISDFKNIKTSMLELSLLSKSQTNHLFGIVSTFKKS